MNAPRTPPKRPISSQRILDAEIFNAERVPRYAETLAMALAEVGRFDDAGQLQQLLQPFLNLR